MKKRKGAVFLLAFVLLYFLVGSGAALAAPGKPACSGAMWVGKLVKLPVMAVKEAVVFKYRWDHLGSWAALQRSVQGLFPVVEAAHRLLRIHWDAARAS